MLIAYDAAGNIIATLNAIGTVDLAATVWRPPSGAVGSAVWPGKVPNVHEYRVELAGEAGAKYIAALVPLDGRRKRIERPIINIDVALREVPIPGHPPIEAREAA